eukprot:3941214-Rhodomonas_salina.3
MRKATGTVQFIQRWCDFVFDFPRGRSSLGRSSRPSRLPLSALPTLAVQSALAPKLSQRTAEIGALQTEIARYFGAVKLIWTEIAPIRGEIEPRSSVCTCTCSWWSPQPGSTIPDLSTGHRIASW